MLWWLSCEKKIKIFFLFKNSDDKKRGAKCELDTVFSKQNIIPRKVNAKCDVAVFGQYVNLMDVSA